MINYNSQEIGFYFIEQNGKSFRISLRSGNCMNIHIYTQTDENGDRRDTLYNFVCDTDHLKRMERNKEYRLLDESAYGVTLDADYKDNWKYAQALCRQGFEVTMKKF